MVVNRDEPGLERAYFDSLGPPFFAVDWGEDDTDTVAYAAKALNLGSLSAEWQDDDLVIRLDDREVKVPLQMDVADRHTTVCALNDILSPNHEVRFLSFTHGSDTLGFAALGSADWQKLEAANGDAVEENFLDPRKLPNLMTELTQDTLPPKARARVERMIERLRKKKQNSHLGAL